MAPLVPRIVADAIRVIGERARAIDRLSGFASRARMIRMAIESILRIETDRPAADTAVRVRVREKGNKLMWLRPRSRDRAAFDFLFEDHHLPPAELAGPIDRIAIFGANIGLLLADLATRYPDARLLGIEPDPDNAVLARHNVAHLGDRCRVMETAVWHRDEPLELSWERDAWGLDLTDSAPAQDTNPAQDTAPAESRLVGAADAGALLKDFAGGAPVDYLLVNIETAWYEMLRHGAWTSNVRCIKIEIQDHYEDAVPLLERLGYRAQLHRLSWGAFVVGIRP